MKPFGKLQKTPNSTFLVQNIIGAHSLTTWSCIILGKYFKHLEPQFPHQLNGNIFPYRYLLVEYKCSTTAKIVLRTK